jgi:hypothetical protein
VHFFIISPLSFRAENNPDHIHNLYGGLPLRGDMTDCTVKPTRALINDSNTSNILKGVSGPSLVRHTYSSEGGLFSATISCLCVLAFFLYFGVLFDY